MIIVSAPMALAANILTKPIGPSDIYRLGLNRNIYCESLPAPVTNTLDPIVTPARRHA